MDYAPLSGAHLTADQASRYGKRLAWLHARGELSPEQVIDDARKRTSPLHEYFEWDDQEAAQRWRFTQAEYLIRNIGRLVVVNDEKPVVLREWWRVTVDEGEEELQSIETIAKDPQEYRALLLAEEAKLAASAKRLRYLAQYFDANSRVHKAAAAVERAQKYLRFTKPPPVSAPPPP